MLTFEYMAMCREVEIFLSSITEELSSMRDANNSFNRYKEDCFRNEMLGSAPVVANNLIKEKNGKELLDEIKKIEIYNLFNIESQFKKVQSECYEKFHLVNSPLDRCVRVLSIFRSKYDAFYRLAGIDDFIEAVDALKAFFLAYEMAKNSVRESVFYLSRASENDRVDNSLFIALENVEYNVYEFTQILENIQKAYVTLQMVNGSNEKLQIVKIESGSFMSWLFGDKGILSVLAKALESLTDTLFRKYTKEGKLLTHNESILALRETAELSNFLKENGHNTDVADAAIGDTLGCLAVNLQNIVNKSPNVKINDEVFSLKQEISQKYIEDSSKKLFQNTSDKEVTLEDFKRNHQDFKEEQTLDDGPTLEM